MLEEKKPVAPLDIPVVVATARSTAAPASPSAVARYIEALGLAYAERTRQSMASDWRCFARWCRENALIPFPASAATVIAYLQALTPGHRLSTLRRRLATLSHLHQAFALANPADDHQVRLTLRGLARLKGGRPEGRRAPLRERDIERMLAASGGALRDCRDRAILLTARDSLARRSELARLKVADIEFRRDLAGARLLLRRTKADPDGRSAWLSPATTQALNAWLKRARISEGPVFRQVDNGGRVGAGLHPQAIARRFKVMARAAGLDASKVSGHSTRIGMCVDLVADGQSLTAIQLAGGWVSPALPAHYAADLLPEQGAVARYYRAREALPALS